MPTQCLLESLGNILGRVGKQESHEVGDGGEMLISGAEKEKGTSEQGAKRPESILSLSYGVSCAKSGILL